MAGKKRGQLATKVITTSIYNSWYYVEAHLAGPDYVSNHGEQKHVSVAEEKPRFGTKQQSGPKKKS